MQPLSKTRLVKKIQQKLWAFENFQSTAWATLSEMFLYTHRTLVLKLVKSLHGLNKSLLIFYSRKNICEKKAY